MTSKVDPEQLDDIELLESLDRAIGLTSELAAHRKTLVENRRRRNALLAQLDELVQERQRRECAPKITRVLQHTRPRPFHGDVGLLAATLSSRRVLNRTGAPLGAHSTGPNVVTAWVVGGVLSFLPRQAWLALVAASPGLAQRFLVLEPGNDESFENMAGVIERTGAQYPGELYEHMRSQIRRENDTLERGRASSSRSDERKEVWRFGLSERS